MKIREAVFKGRFYPDEAIKIDILLKKVRQFEKSYFDFPMDIHTVYGAVLPHAGYVYSAYQAIHYFEYLKQQSLLVDTFVIVNPNHTGYGMPISLDNHDFWNTPYGKIELDKEFMNLLPFSVSPEAHREEHSGEVLLPYLQYYLSNKFKIIPITLSVQNPQNAKKIAEEIFRVAKKLNRKIQFIASSDFTHFETPEFGAQQDQYLLDEIEKNNVIGFYDQLKKHQVSACGYGPIMSLMYYSQLMTDTPISKILKRGHSGEVYASAEVVDYISILFYS